MLFPTIRFAMFFAVVMPASWFLMPIPGRVRAQRAQRRVGRRVVSGASDGRGDGGPDDRPVRDHHQTWTVPWLMLVGGALAGPLAPGGGWLAWSLAGDPFRATAPHWLVTSTNGLLWLVGLALMAMGFVRWLDLRGLTRWNVFMLLASCVFYGAYSWWFVGLLLLSSVVNQIFASAIHANRTDRGRRVLLTFAVVVNLGVLAWFKYRGFFLENTSNLFSGVGIHFKPPGGALIPPVGISFFTFQALSYVIDTYRRKLEPVPLLEFAVYLSFFPHVVAGPIVRAAEFLPQLRVPRDARQIDTGLAFWLIAVGLFKKVVVSSYLASAAADPVFRIPEHHQTVDTLMGIYAYAIQIYCDFSGYTDMAIGLALLIGFRFPQNFDAPYTADSLQDFWRRWHMTLSRWLRDYLYIPMGGNQGSVLWGFCTLFLTMLIGGLWHGAAWTFVIWGALHGAWLVIERLWHQRRADHVYRRSERTRLWINRIVTFHVVCLAWVFFRATSYANARQVLGRLFHLGLGSGLNWVVLGTVAIFLATQFVPSNVVGRLQATLSNWRTWQQGLVLAAWITFTSALSPTGVAPFIYFNF